MSAEAKYIVMWIYFDWLDAMLESSDGPEVVEEMT